MGGGPDRSPSSLLPAAGRLAVPGDPSQAAFFVVAGTVVPGSEVEVAGVYEGPARLGFLDRPRADGGVAHAFGGRRRCGRRDADRRDAGLRGPATTTIRAVAGPLRATEVAASEIPSLDEIPALAVAAAVAEGTTAFTDVGELRVKEVDRLSAVAALVEAFGATAKVMGDTLLVTGVGGPLRGARFDSRGDHRMAMAAAVAGLAAAPGERSLITGFDAVETSYPRFADDLGTLAGGPGDAAHHAGHSRSTPARGGHRRTGRGGQVDGGRSGGPGPAHGPARHGGDVPRRGRPGAGPRHRTRRRGRPWRRSPAAARIEVGERVVIDDLDVTDVIRSPEVGRAVSIVAANADVRRVLVERQRSWAEEHGGGVVEGRDIGSVVFPGAALKVYLTASAEERASRRRDEAPEGLARRDRIDSTRQVSPLREAPDAHRLDTTGRDIDDVVEEVLSWL